MRIPAKCNCGGRALVYANVKHATFAVQYRRCDKCRETSKSIRMKSCLSSKHVVELVPDAKTMGTLINNANPYGAGR